MAVTKRTLLGIYERVQSAVDELSEFSSRNQQVSPHVADSIIQRDLQYALNDLSYAMEVAD